MIIGTGNDIVRISRIEKLLEKYGDKFLEKVYTPDEIAKCNARKNRVQCLALRFAAKEAFLKALKTGMRYNVKLSEVEVINNEDGAPSFKLYGLTKQFTKNLHVKHIHLALTDDGDYAMANVILER